MTAWLWEGDCIQIMREKLAENSIHAIVCDPPYGIGFMGRKWDVSVPGEEWARECLRVLKPGGHLVAFAATRTVHRLGVAVEDAGFELRDMVAWQNYQGFPKSLDVSKAIDAMHGAERKVVGRGESWNRPDSKAGDSARMNASPGSYDLTEPATEDAKKWNGFGTALKPAFEPALLARKPLIGTVAANVLEHGTGALNIDGCRYAYGDPAWPGPDGATCRANVAPFHFSGANQKPGLLYTTGGHDLGRWPANIYVCPKPSRAERERGCERLPGRTGAEAVDRNEGTAGLDNPRAGAGRTADRVKNYHPTVKPIGVMRWLCRLVGGQKGSVILDPFMGSGTTGIAAISEGFHFMGLEQNAEYMDIAEARILDTVGPLFAGQIHRQNHET
jgi:DNA modification methylase